MTTTVNIDKEVKAYKKRIREGLVHDKIRFSTDRETGDKIVLKGMKNWGCEIAYSVAESSIICTKFKARSGGMFISFSEKEAEWGLNFLFGLAEIYNVESLVIENTIHDEKEYKYMRKYPFVFQKDDEESYAYACKSILNLKANDYLDTWNLHKSLETALSKVKNLEPTTKYELISSFKSPYKYSFYYKTIKGNFFLKQENGQHTLSCEELNVNVPIKSETVSEDLDEFLNQIFMAGRLSVELSPNKDVFNAALIRMDLSKIEGEQKEEIFSALMAKYDLVEIDDRLHKKDYDKSTEMEYTEHVVTWCRFLDLYMTISNEGPVHITDDIDKSMSFFKETAQKKYANYLDESIQYLRSKSLGEEE